MSSGSHIRIHLRLRSDRWVCGGLHTRSPLRLLPAVHQRFASSAAGLHTSAALVNVPPGAGSGNVLTAIDFFSVSSFAAAAEVEKDITWGKRPTEGLRSHDTGVLLNLWLPIEGHTLFYAANIVRCVIVHHLKCKHIRPLRYLWLHVTRCWIAALSSLRDLFKPCLYSTFY